MESTDSKFTTCHFDHSSSVVTEHPNHHYYRCLMMFRQFPCQENGGSPVTNYVVEKQNTKTGEWSTVTAFARSPMYNVSGLEEGQMYRFRVRAANEYGVSEPLDGDKPIVAENPYSESVASDYSYTRCCRDHVFGKNIIQAKQL